MNISVYLNDGEVISSVDINEATVEEALSAIKAFGFGENKEEKEWKEMYKLECQRNDEIKMSYDKLKKTDGILQAHCKYYKDNYRRCSDEVNALKETLNEVQEECDEWKEKYKIECQNNDAIKKSYDRLTDSFENLLRDRDEWREKYAIECKDNDENKKAYDQLVKDFTVITNERDEYKEIASDRDDLKVENDKVKELCDMLQDEKDELQKRFNLVRDDLFQANHQVSELTAEKDKLNMALVGAKSRCATLEQDKFFWKNRWESEFNECVKLKKELEGCQNKKSES